MSAAGGVAGGGRILDGLKFGGRAPNLMLTDYQDTTAALAADSEQRVAAAYALLAAGQLGRAEAVEMMAGIVNRANAAAVVLADAGIAVQIEQASAVATPLLGIIADDDTERLAAAVETILTGDGDTAMQLSRLARAEPLSATQQASCAAMSAHRGIAGWVRVLNAGACELCQWWAHGDRLYPVDQSFRSHPGCNCSARIMLTGKDITHAG